MLGISVMLSSLKTTAPQAHSFVDGKLWSKETATGLQKHRGNSYEGKIKKGKI